jgi:hypothetical protein
MENTIIEWNKNIEYYDLGNIIQTNLSHETLQWINERYNFLVYDMPVVKIFFIEKSNSREGFSINYRDYDCEVKETYDFQTDLDKIMFKYNIIRDKKICLIYSITKHSNYNRIRYMYIDIENNVSVKYLKSIIRKAKIKLLLDNTSDKKPSQNFVQGINISSILTEEI